MKKVLALSICSLGLLTVASCDVDEFLDTTNTDFIPADAAFENDENAKLTMNGVYDMMFPSGHDGDWGFKPNLFSGTHPTMDTQCTGWDVKFLDQSWDATTTELGSGWAHAYHAIHRANEFLFGLDNSLNVSPALRKSLGGEARAVRGFFYSYLAQTWGRVPMCVNGENFNNMRYKPKAETYEEMWDFIIEDFKAAADSLDWKPMDGQYGRATKGMALSYLGDAYMWKAYRCPDKADECYKLAKAALKEVLEKGPYKLQPSFSTLWDPEGAWSKECIWAQVIDEGEGWTGWNNLSTNFNLKWYVACPENGGWGSLFLSWEWYACYEQGDERRDASCCTGAVPADSYEQVVVDVNSPSYGKHPFLNINVGKGTDDTQTKQYHFFNGEYAPAIWTTKLWRNGHAGDLNGVGSWGWGMWAPSCIYYKRLPNVMLDYAECCFRTGEEDKGWEQLDILRRRAFGLDEVGVDLSRYLAHHNYVCEKVKVPVLEKYPIQNQDATKSVMSAKELYTNGKDGSGYKSPRGKTFASEPWKVAVNEERRKEFNTEWCLRPDMQKSGFMADHIETNYPTDTHKGDALKNYPWSHREFTYDDKKMDMPFPANELLENPALVQNDAYLGNNAK